MEIIDMSTKIRIQSDENQSSTSALVKSAISAEITRLEMAIELSLTRLNIFEKKYHVSSEKFILGMVAEDLDGGDEEYIIWMGEFRLKQKLEKKLSRLRSIEYEH